MRYYIFRAIYFSLIIRGIYRSGTDNQSISEFIDWSYLFTDMYALPRAAVQIAQEINEAERPGWMRGRASKGPRDQFQNSELFLFLWLSAWRLGGT